MDLLSLIFPRSCANCNKLGPYLCADCFQQLQFIKLPIRLKLEPLYLDKVWSACVFKPPLNSLIYQLKYQSAKPFAEYCGKLLYISQTLPPVDLITAVPLSKHRYDERGFNQAKVIAQTLATFAKIRYADTLLRTKQTPTQASLTDRQQRLTNLDSTFSVIPDLDLTAKSILLIDDVLTTGTTLNQCAKTLKKQGVRQVFGLTVAHGS